MKTEPVLESVYARIDILDLNNEDASFTKRASLYLLGKGSEYVKTIADLSLKNKRLTDEIGVETVKELIGDYASIKGGDWDELDEMDLDELLNSEPEPQISPAVPKSITNEYLTGVHFSEYVLYSKDKLSDVREMLAITTKIKPYKQYIWVPSAHCSLTGDTVNLFSHWATSLRKVNGFPIDGHINNTFTQPSIQTFVNKSAVILSMVNLDSIVNDKTKLQFLSRSDIESFELIHANSIERFFPLVTLPVFNQYLVNEKEIESKYESLDFDRTQKIEEYKQRNYLLKELSKQPKISIDDTDLLSVSTLDIVMLSTYGDRIQRIDMLKLFQHINTVDLDDIGYIDLYSHDESRQSVRLRKVQQKDQFRINQTDSSPSFNLFHSKNNLVYSKSIVVTLLPRSEYESATLLFDKFGTVWLKFQPNQSHSYSKASFIEFITSIIDPIIQKFNSFDRAFASHERFAKVSDNSSYQILSSSSRITFKFPVSFSKLLDTLISKLMESGFIESWDNEKLKKQKFITSFILKYGVSNSTNQKVSLINIKNVNEIALIELSNLDLQETNLYIDIIGRIVASAAKTLRANEKAQTQLSVVDPVLFRPKTSVDGYSRICQKRFQPVISTKEDPKSIEYYNFTFQRPEYYKCPSSEHSILGFIQGKHDKGYCLPCCRKTEQPNADLLKQSCIDNDSLEEQKQSTYKIEYPISEIPNSKIMNRRINMPLYVTQLFGMKNIVANGTIMTSHVDIRNGNDPDASSFLQTATMIAAVQSKKLVPLYKSVRLFILDIITMIKQPSMQINIMKHKLVADRFTTPQMLIHSLEDTFLKNSILGDHSELSATDWNDLIVFLANCMGLNVLLLADNRIHNENIQLTNLYDIDATKPTLILLKRINIEWSSNSHNTRSLYLPITTSLYKVSYKTPLVIERLNISETLIKVKRIMSDSTVKKISKQFTIENITQFVSGNKQYKILEYIADQKLAVIGIGKNNLVTTVASMATTIKPMVIDTKPSVTLSDVLILISNYNAFVADAADMNAYKDYLQAALKMNPPYQYLDLNSFLMKVHKIIKCEQLAIGVIVHAFDSKTPISSELMFFKPCSIKQAIEQISKYDAELVALHKRINAKAILTYPIESDLKMNDLVVDWLIHPLQASELHNVCKKNLKVSFDIGMYNNEIYHLYSNHIIKQWMSERPVKLESFLLERIKALGAPPIIHTKIDTLIQDAIRKYPKYDPTIIRIVIVTLFDEINPIAKSNQVIQNKFKSSDAFIGFDLKNVHRFTRSELETKLALLNKSLIDIVTQYPTFKSSESISDQRELFYKKNKLMVHKDIFQDVVEMLVADLMNPFRRDYIINAKLIESTLVDIIPHLGELIYIQYINKR